MPPDTQVPLPPTFLEDLGAVEHRVMGRYLEECRLEWEEYGQKLKAGSVSDLCSDFLLVKKAAPRVRRSYHIPPWSSSLPAA